MATLSRNMYVVVNFYGRTPLHYSGNREVTKVLLSAGAVADVKDNDGKVTDDLVAGAIAASLLSLYQRRPTGRPPVKKESPLSTMLPRTPSRVIVRRTPTVEKNRFHESPMPAVDKELRR